MCNYFKISRNAYYKSVKTIEKSRIKQELVLNLVHSVKAEQPRVGGKKLYRHLSSELHLLGKIVINKNYRCNGLLKNHEVI